MNNEAIISNAADDRERQPNGAADDTLTATGASGRIDANDADINDSVSGGGGGGDEDGVTHTGERRIPTPIGTQRVVQIVLGCFWIIDAALQYQPFMFGKQFVPTFITGNAAGQPEPVSWLITTAGHFISPDIVVWNALFATIQVLIGVGLLNRPTVRAALVTSFFWVFGVWFFGEGMSMMLTGTASALSGAPGSVLLYGLIGLTAWPRSPRVSKEDGMHPLASGIDSSAAAHGLGGSVTPLAVWSGFWFLAAVLFLLPANRVATSVSGAITSMAPGQPGWYAHALIHVGNGFGSAGVQQAWVLAILCVVTGLGPLLVRRYEIFLGVGVVLSILFWLTAQGLGGVLTGSGTDPNTGPLVIFLALAMMPAAVAERAAWSPPIAGLIHRRPALASAGAVGVFCALLLAATYPAAAQPSGGSGAMSGMNMSASSTSGSSMSGMAGMSTSTQNSSTAHCSGTNHNGLDLTNSPIMAMGDTPGVTMNMNGEDASAAAGLNATTTHWTYTGPALPGAEANELLTDGVNGSQDVHMAASGCAAEPTFSQEISAFSYVSTTSSAAGKYPTPTNAVAGGYELVSPADYPVTYYVNPAIVSANEAAKRTLESNAIDGLVYAETPSGEQVLAAAMYILPSSLAKPPMPYGPLVQWHQRTDVCVPSAPTGASPLVITGVAPCATSSVKQPTPYLTMVWQVPVAGGPLAIQPPDVQIVEAAVMAQQSG